jgi:2-polyprenyl-3-methyl-5-hydroxy-6-metoxy-1,4-benzoquinol methylase
MNSRILKEKLIINLTEPIFNYDARRRFKKFIKPDDYILDIGAFKSPFTMGLNNKVTAIDIMPQDNEFGFNEKILNKLRSRPNIEIKVMDAQKMDFADNQFDVILITEVLEHIPDDKKAAQEILRVLKPGGFLLLTVPHLERVPLEAGISEHYRHYKKKDLIHLFGEEDIIFLIDRFKFKEVIWASYFITRYSETKNKIFLLFLPIEVIVKNILTYFWLPLSEKIYSKKPGYNLVMVMQKKHTQKILPVNDKEYSLYFIELTKKFLSEPDSDPQFQLELDFFINYSKKFSKGNNLLEIGCGTGRTLLFLAKKGYDCLGIDFDSTQIKFAEEIRNELGIKNIAYLKANISDKISLEKKFDIIISNHLVEHLPDEELVNYFDQVNSLLNENGIFLIHSTPLKYTYLLKKKFIFFVMMFSFLPDNLFNRYLKLLDFTVPRIYKVLTGKNLQDTWQDLPPGHCNPPDEDIIRTQLEKSGFKVEEINTSHRGVHKFSRIFRRIVRSKKLDNSIFIFCTKGQIT